MSQETSLSSVRTASLLKALQKDDDEIALMEALKIFQTQPTPLDDSATLCLLKSLVHLTKTFFQLRALMVLFLRKMTAVMEGARNLKNEQIILEEVLRTMKDFWSLCSNQQQVIDPQKEFGSYDSSCFEVLPSLASVYIDLVITIHRQDSTEKALKGLHSLLLFDLNTRAAKAALLEVSSCTAEAGKMLTPLLRSLLSKHPAPPEDSCLDYLLHMLLLKRWMTVCPGLEDIVRVSRSTKAPAGFITWFCLVWPDAKDYVPTDKSLHGSTVSQFFLDIGSETVEPLIDVFSRCISASEEQAQVKAGKEKRPGKHKAVKPADMKVMEDNEDISIDVVETAVEKNMLQRDGEFAEEKQASQSEKATGSKWLRQASPGFQVDRTSNLKIKETLERNEELNTSGNESRKWKKTSKRGLDIQGNDDNDDEDNERSVSYSQQGKRRKNAYERNSVAVLDFQIDRGPNKKASKFTEERETVEDEDCPGTPSPSSQTANGRESDKEDEEDEGEIDDVDEEQDVVDDEYDEEEQMDDGGEEPAIDDDEEEQNIVDDEEDNSDDEQVVADQKNFTNVKKKVHKEDEQETILEHVIDRGGGSVRTSSVKKTKTVQYQEKPLLFSTDAADHYFVESGGQRGQDDPSNIQVIETANIHTVAPKEQQRNEEESRQKSTRHSSHMKKQVLRCKPSGTKSKAVNVDSGDSEESDRVLAMDGVVDSAALIEEQVGKKLSEIRQSLEAEASKGAVCAVSSFTKRTPLRKLRSDSENSNSLKSSSLRRRSRSETEELVVMTSSLTSSRRKTKSESEKMGSVKITRNHNLQAENKKLSSQKDAGKESSSPTLRSKNCAEMSQTPLSRAKGKQEAESVLSELSPWLRKLPGHSARELAKSEPTRKKAQEAVVSCGVENSTSGKKLRSSHVTVTGEKRSSSQEKVKSPKTVVDGMEDGVMEGTCVEKKMPHSLVRTCTAEGTPPRLASQGCAHRKKRTDTKGKDPQFTRTYNLRTPVKVRETSEVVKDTSEKTEVMDTEETPRLEGLKARRKSTEPKHKSPVSRRVTRRMSLRAAATSTATNCDP